MASLPVHRAVAAEVTLTVEVEARALDGERTPTKAEIVVAQAATREVVARHTLRELPGTVAAVVPETASGWVVLATAPGWWAPTTRVAADSRGASVPLVPKGQIRFDLEGSDVGVAALDGDSVKIVGRLWAPGERLARGVYGGSCEVVLFDDARDAAVSCPFARGEKADIQVSLGPFLPWVRAGVTVGRDSDFGMVTPVWGAVVAGSLRTGAGEGPHLLALVPRNGALPVTSWTEGFGAFGFEGLSAGTYDLRLEESPHDSWTVRVESLGDRIDLGEVASAALNRFTLDILGPSAIIDGLKVSASRIRFRDDGRPDGNLLARHVAERSFEGGWSFTWSGLPAGHYWVFLEGLWGTRWYTEIIEFSDFGRDLVDLDALAVRGRIRRGGEPLEDVLVWFGGLNGGERIVFRSREAGRFEGFLPKHEDWGEDAGSWAVQVTPAPACDPCEGDWRSGDWGGFDAREAVAGGKVVVVEGADGVARVDIDLPDGRVEGRLMRFDPDGVTKRGVAGAQVELDVEKAWFFGWSAVTSEGGNFEFTGVPDGVVRLNGQAVLDDQLLRSDQVELRISGGEPVDDLELVLQPQRRMRFHVRSQGGGVVGAVALIRYVDPGRGEVRRRGLTGVDGSVVFWLPRSLDSVELVMFAEGLGTESWRGSVPATAEVDVALSHAKGDLLLSASVGSRNGAIISARGVVMNLSSLRSNGQLYEREGDQVVRNLAPGHYSWCPEPGECTAATVIADTLNMTWRPSDQ